MEPLSQQSNVVATGLRRSRGCDMQGEEQSRALVSFVDSVSARLWAF